MTEQQLACTLCGAGGHSAAQCNWNKASAKIAVVSLRAGLRTLADYIGPKCRNAVEVAMATTCLDDTAQHPEQAEGALRCTCPSGNGSLQWPCPEHSGGAQGEREAFEAYRDRRNAQLESEGHKPGSKWHVTHAHYATWEAARAALAQPSTRKSHVSEALRAADWSNTCIGNKALIEAAIEHLEAQPSPAPELVHCACGDAFPVNSYGAGFMDANNGVCENCDAATAAQAGQVPENVRDELARRCLWLAFCWNDHNFEAAHICARKEAEKHGITSLDEANAWLAAAPAQGGE